MDSTADFFKSMEPSELLDLLIDETAGSLSLLSEFSLEGQDIDDEVVDDRPGASDIVRIALRFGFRTERGSRMGFLQVPLGDALVLAGSLLMLPTEELEAELEKEAPDEAQKEAIMEAGLLLGGAFDSVLKKRFSEQVDVAFFGCQGLDVGCAAWVSGYGGEPLAVRRQMASFGTFAPFELLLAVPA